MALTARKPPSDPSPSLPEALAVTEAQQACAAVVAERESAEGHIAELESRLAAAESALAPLREKLAKATAIDVYKLALEEVNAAQAEYDGLATVVKNLKTQRAAITRQEADARFKVGSCERLLAVAKAKRLLTPELLATVAEARRLLDEGGHLPVREHFPEWLEPPPASAMNITSESN